MVHPVNENCNSTHNLPSILPASCFQRKDIKFVITKKHGGVCCC